ncbi:MAG: hypothetical protein HON50_09230 [Candidatus Marinimicrobia bacterium]|jgi:hypothetical protein|nr:hypothetical protein [Candidatus Neomarinimicrobiota bacterium]
MHHRSHKTIHILLTIAVLSYSLLALGHFGHSHEYGRADSGYCTTHCENNQHFDTKPLCKGFPLDLTLGIIQGNLVSEIGSPVFYPEAVCHDQHTITPHLLFKDKSRAPPLG